MTIPSITSLGIGSGIDANNIVSQLMTLERIPLNALKARQATFEARISAFGNIKSRFDALATAAQALADPSRLAGFTASLGNDSVATVSAGPLANAGSYNLNVLSVAQAQKSFSPVTAEGQSFGSGTLRFEIDGETREIAFAGGNINDVRAAINAANIGVSATTVRGDAGDTLILTAAATGTDGAFSLTIDSTDANLTGLANFDAGNPNARTAQNAVVELDGITVTSQSNDISTALSGVTINVREVGTTSIDIARSSDNTIETVKNFVEAFNAAARELRSSSSYDGESGRAGALNGDATVRTLVSMLNRTVGDAPSALQGTAFETLSSLGIAFQRDGTLALNETTLQNAIATDFASVVTTLSTFGANTQEMAQRVTAFDGLLTTRSDGMRDSVRNLESQQERLQYQLELTEKRLRAQFVALDTLMGQLSVTSSYLTQQLATLIPPNAASNR